MKEDRDLQFLASCKSEDLKTLVDMMTSDKDGNVRLSEQLTNTDAYLRYYPDRLPCMWQEIANELQRFGGNTIVNVFRKGGVCYREILQDVCRKMEVWFSDLEETAEIERRLLEKVCMETVRRMPEKELRQMAEQLDIGEKHPQKFMLMFALQMAIRKGGVLFTRIALYVAQMISKMLLGRGILMFGGNLLNKAFGFLGGPIGWAVTLGWGGFRFGFAGLPGNDSLRDTSVVHAFAVHGRKEDRL
ncbi:DUF3944 domain-containing protein [Bacteroides sp. An269]|uniref:DUF3944 domain-containing protein n=1 Tax=Bacteroides sp. An269 TaxID=1965613 RepID=UPI001302270B|nr:DUF3944 domain-containing protein [Bacteroides sp. An269]